MVLILNIVKNNVQKAQGAVNGAFQPGSLAAMVGCIRYDRYSA